MAPEQLRIVKVKDNVAINQMIDDLTVSAKEHGVRYTVDDSNNSIGKKVRAAELYKVPYVIVVGDKEAESGKIGVRIRKDLVGDGTDESKQFAVTELMTAIQAEHDSRTKLSTL